MHQLGQFHLLGMADGEAFLCWTNPQLGQMLCLDQPQPSVWTNHLFGQIFHLQCCHHDDRHWMRLLCHLGIADWEVSLCWANRKFGQMLCLEPSVWNPPFGTTKSTVDFRGIRGKFKVSREQAGNHPKWTVILRWNMPVVGPMFI